ncbi:RNA recognition motif domain-containing protein [Patescibacteria group bacterium]
MSTTALRKDSMAVKLFVGSLPWATRDEDLKQLFSQHGAVESANVVMDRATGRSRGFGFVEMTSEEEAQKAIEALHESELEGRTIVVNKARPKTH